MRDQATEKRDIPAQEASSSPSSDRLWWIIVSPTIWAIHFLACYVTVAIWCAKRSGSENLGPVGGLVAAYTLLAIVGIGIQGVHSYRKHRYGSGVLPHDQGTADDRSRFIGFSALLLAILSFVATLFTALVFVFVRSCD